MSTLNSSHQFITVSTTQCGRSFLAMVHARGSLLPGVVVISGRTRGNTYSPLFLFYSMLHPTWTWPPLGTHQQPYREYLPWTMIPSTPVLASIVTGRTPLGVKQSSNALPLFPVEGTVDHPLPASVKAQINSGITADSWK